MAGIAHISIVPSDSICPQTFTKCTDKSCCCGGSLYHCYLCSPSFKKGSKEGILVKHFEKKHWIHRICHNGHIMMRCFLECSTTTGKAVKTFHKRSHWHCYLCTQIFRRISEFRMHLSCHEKKTYPQLNKAPEDPAVNDGNADTNLSSKETGAQKHEDTCTECGKRFQSKHTLQRHVRDVYKKKREGVVTASKYLTGICVDFNNGIFMVRRSFTGVSRPIHCQHSTYAVSSTAGVSACELNECRGAAVVARLSGHPALECIHLQSVQYAQPYQQPLTLTETSLDDLVGEKLSWFKENKKKECLSLKHKAEEGGYPLIVHFPMDEQNTTSERFWYFSVYDGGIHYWSRFGRVIVGFDKQNSSLPKKWLLHGIRQLVLIISTLSFCLDFDKSAR